MAGRENIYYWKCDRPSAFFAISEDKAEDTDMVKGEVIKMLSEYFGDAEFLLESANGQGNHITFLATRQGKKYFIRVENGPERDDYMDVEAAVINKVRELGIPSPYIFAVDSLRVKYPFAYQIMEYIEYSDLNKLYKAGDLDSSVIMKQLGVCIACWQRISNYGYGPYDPDILRHTGKLVGYLTSYRDYYNLNLDRHLDFLTEKNFLTRDDSQRIRGLIEKNSSCLDISSGCLVHKDLALWNVLGTSDTIKSIIDWDDVISGDPTDDISLMACFHSGKEIISLIGGYESESILPENFELRFWLHLLRNMIFKAVIRVGAGYFKKDNAFFLINSDNDGGKALYDFTHSRIELACKGLSGKAKISEL